MRDIVNPNLEIGLGDIEFDGVSLLYNEFDVDSVYKDTGFEPAIDFAKGVSKTRQWIEKREQKDNGV